MKNKLTTWFESKAKAYLSVSVFSLAISLLLNWVFTEGSSQDVFIKEVNQRLYTQISLVDDIALEYKRVFKNVIDIDFSEFTKSEFQYPLLVYKNGKPVYWSDYRYNIPYSELQGNYIEKCIFLPKPESLFFVKRTSLIINNEDFEIYILVPLKRSFEIKNEHLSSGLNPNIFPNQRISIVLNENEGTPIYYERSFTLTKSKTYLFSIKFSPEFLFFADKSWVVFFFSIISILTITLFLGTEIKYLFKNRNGIFAILILFATILGVRALMLILRFPYFMTEFELFSPSSYQPSVITPSLGDLFINILTLFIALVFSLRFFRYWFPYKNVLKFNILQKRIIAVSLVIISYITIHWTYFIISELYTNTSLSLDINQSINFPLFRVFGFAIFVFAVAIYFSVAHIASKIMVRLAENLYSSTVNFVIGSLIYYIVVLVLEIDDLLIFNANALYIAVITFLAMPQSLNRTGYKSLLYLIACSIIGAIIGAYSIYDFEEKRDKAEKRNFANHIVLKRDTVGEIYLREVIDEIKADQFIQKKLVIGMPFRKDVISKRIQRIHLHNYLEKYDTDILLFNGAGRPFFSEEQTYQQIFNQYNNEDYKTNINNVFYANELKPERKQYICFIDIQNEEGNTIGHIILNLQLKRMIPNSINQSFLVDEKYKDVTLTDNYSYAIYDNKELIYSFGDFAYDNSFLEPFFHEKGFILPEINFDNYHHLCIKRENQIIVVSSVTYPQNYILANFSFLFLLLIFTILSSYFIYGLSRTAYYNLTFATKVQLYLNLAFFVPLLIVSIITISILNNTNVRETQFYFLEKARNVSESDNLISTVSGYIKGEISRDQLLLEIANISDFTQSDINLYDKNGKLLVTSQSYLFDHNLLSNYINPKAYAGVAEQKQRKMLLPESIGSLEYNTAYVGIQSYETGEVIGIVGIPFYGASLRFEGQIIEVLTTIVQVFTFIFIILVVLSYFSAKSLIHPIRLITQKIRRTTLNEHNEPLDYHADDEFGLLAGEYNKMITKLEESREALAHNQKEAAWREMAKQVAHEIKNPLTPMKLTLQQLQRRLGDINGTKQPLHTLLEQVDILSDIATSFASFAKMPIPISEEFEIAAVLKKTLNLHDVRREIEIIDDIPDEDFYVMGDSQLMYRIFTNLLLNGIQSVPNDRKVQLEVTLTSLYPQRILIEIKDNGLGIPQHIQNKVFMPNFTTKTTGSGIGLAIAKRGIEHSGGAIWFETEMDEGTSFYIEFPLCERKIITREI